MIENLFAFFAINPAGMFAQPCRDLPGHGLPTVQGIMLQGAMVKFEQRLLTSFSGMPSR